MGQPAISVLTCIIAGYAIAVALHPVFRHRNGFSFLAISLACIAVILCLLIVPREQVVLRAVTAVLIVDLCFRLIDFARQSWHDNTQTISWASYCSFLIPFPVLLCVFGQKDRRIPPAERNVADVIRVLRGATGVAIGFLLLSAANHNLAIQSSTVLNQISKVLLFSVTIESISQVLRGLEHLAGFDTRPIVDRAFLARTPAEFWERFNTRVHSWLYRNVFLPSGGRRAPVRGIWATFVASAIFHELGFAIATSQVTGNQLIFFLLQAPAVLASPLLNRISRAWGTPGMLLSRSATILWIGTTSIFFFKDVGRVFQFFYNR